MAFPRPGLARLLLLIAPRAVGWVDGVLIAACALTLLGIGIFYARRQRTTEEYFVSGRNRRSFIPGISLVAAMFSLVAYIGNPGEVVQHGPVLVCAVLVALPFGYLAVGWLLIPLIMRLPITSAYELLELRLGRSVRLLGAATFVCMRLVWMSLILCTAATVLVAVMDCGPQWVPAFEIGLCLVATTYTLIGGIDAVMVTSVLEFFLLIIGAALTIASISWRMGGVAAWWPHHWQAHWPAQPFFSWSPLVRVTAVGTFVSNVISTICGAGSDQVNIQRYLTTRDAATARRAFLTGALGIGSLMLILGLVGLALLGFYSHLPGGLPANLSFERHGDAFFPHYISHYLPAGASGLVISALLASAVSGISPGMNSVTTVISKDFIGLLWPAAARTDAEQLRTARVLVFVIGLVVLAGSRVVALVGGDLIEVSSKTVNLLFYPMFGLFFLAMFVPFGTTFGAILGMAYSVAAAVLIGYWDTLTGQPRLSFQWIAPVSFATSLAFGCLFSLVPTRGISRRRLASYTGTALAVLSLAIAWVVRT